LPRQIVDGRSVRLGSTRTSDNVGLKEKNQDRWGGVVVRGARGGGDFQREHWRTREDDVTSGKSATGPGTGVRRFCPLLVSSGRFRCEGEKTQGTWEGSKIREKVSVDPEDGGTGMGGEEWREEGENWQVVK